MTTYLKSNYYQGLRRGVGGDSLKDQRNFLNIFKIKNHNASSEKGSCLEKEEQPPLLSIETTKAAVEKEEETTKKEEQPVVEPPKVEEVSQDKKEPNPPPASESSSKNTISLKKKAEDDSAQEKSVQLTSKQSSDQQVAINKPAPSDIKKVLTIGKSQPAVVEAPKVAPTSETMIINLKSKPAEIASALLEKADTAPPADESLPQDLQSLS